MRTRSKGRACRLGRLRDLADGGRLCRRDRSRRVGARLAGLGNLSIADPIVWWGAAYSLLSSSSLKPPAYVTLLGVVPHLLYLVGLVLLASTVAAFAHSTGHTWAPFRVGGGIALISVLTAAPSWFWGVTGPFFSVPPAIVEVSAVGWLCARIAPWLERHFPRPSVEQAEAAVR